MEGGQGIDDTAGGPVEGTGGVVDDKDDSIEPPPSPVGQLWGGVVVEPTAAEHGMNVRGPTYLSDKVKIKAGDAKLSFEHIDLLEFAIPQFHVAERPDSWLAQQRAAGNTDTVYFIINLMLPGPPYRNKIVYYTLKPSTSLEKDTPFGRLYSDFMEKDDEYRNGRLKLIPSIVQGPWVVKKTVGNTPAIMGKKLDQTYYRGENYFEVDMNVGTSKVGSTILSAVGGQIKKTIVDMAYVLEGQAKEELPEEIFAIIRLTSIDIPSATKMPLLDGQELPDDGADGTSRRTLSGRLRGLSLSRSKSSGSGGGSTPKSTEVGESIFAAAAGGESAGTGKGK